MWFRLSQYVAEITPAQAPHQGAGSGVGSRPIQAAHPQPLTIGLAADTWLGGRIGKFIK
jgi:hypothetical protein